MAWMNKWNANSFLFGLLRFIHTCYFSVFFALTINDEQHVATCASGPNCPREHVCERAHARCTWTRINGSHLAPDGFGRVSSLALAAVVPLHSAATWEFPRTICLLTPCFTFTPRTWKCGFLVLMGMWGNRKICIFLSMLWSQKHRPCSFATAVSFEFHLWLTINWIIEKLLFVAWNQWSSKGVKVKES